MARRRRKVFYWLQVPGMYWCRMRRAWVPTGTDLPRGGSNVRHFRTAHACFKHAQGVLDRGYEPFVSQFVWRRGRRLARDYGNMEFHEMFDHNARRHEEEHGSSEAA
jgi:hypothetical protein